MALLSAAVSPQNQLASRRMAERDETLPLSGGDLRLSGAHERRGMIAVVAIMAAAVAVVISVLSSSFAQPLPLMLLALLAISGLFFWFAMLAGHIYLGERMPATRFASAISNNLDNAIQVTGRGGQVLWCNSAFQDLVRSAAFEDTSVELRDHTTLKNVFGRTQSVNEALYRLSQAAEEGAFHSEVIVCATEYIPEFNRGGSTINPHGASTYKRAYRVSVRPFVESQAVPAKTVEFGTLAQWLIEDISEQRAREHMAVADLKAQLGLHNSLPLGAFALSEQGVLTQMNTTLRDWLRLPANEESSFARQDLTEFTSKDSASRLLKQLANKDGKTISADIDLKDDAGRLVPVRVSGCWVDAQNHYVLTAQLAQAANDTAADGASSTPTSIDRYLRSAPFGIALINTKGKILQSNANFERLVADASHGSENILTIAEILKQYVDKDVRASVEQRLEQVLTGIGDVAPIDITVGEDRSQTFRVYFQPLPQTDGGEEAAALYVIDVTEHKALEEKFAQSHKMEAVGKLAGGIAHDFNNVLTAIIGFSDLLLQTHRATDPAHKDIMNIKQSAERAAGLVGKLLAFSRRQTFQTEVMHLGDSISDWAQFLKRSIGEKIELSIKSDRDLWLVKSDKTQIEQVITNLSVNARDAMPDGGKLTIRTRNIPERSAQKLANEGLPVGEYVVIEVSDTGFGIDEDLQKKIFEPFFTTKPVGEGTGLGLSTVYGIVKQAGGFLLLDSELGAGTTFRIYLPRFDDENYDHVAEKKKKKKDRPRDLTGSGRVLLVEDEDVVRSFAVRALKRQGYEVLEAASGVEALEVVHEQEGNIDIVVSDVVMPEMDGPTLLKELRKINRELKIIFVSGYPNEAFQEALGQETFAFLPKPFSLPELAAKVKEELES